MNLRALMSDEDRAREDTWAKEKRDALANYHAGDKREIARQMLDTMALTQRRAALKKLAPEARAEMQTLLQEEFESRRNSGDKHGHTDE